MYIVNNNLDPIAYVIVRLWVLALHFIFYDFIRSLELYNDVLCVSLFVCIVTSLYYLLN